MPPATALGWYRQIIRTINRTFAGDSVAVRAAKLELRSSFAANRSITDQGLIQSKVNEAADADAFIRENVIQAKKSNCGQYEVSAETASHLRGIHGPVQ